MSESGDEVDEPGVRRRKEKNPGCRGTRPGGADWLGRKRAAAAHPDPGHRELLHRMNRAEYQNAIRDLLGIDGVDLAVMLPADDASYGFDNIAGVLGMSPTHLDRYLVAARKISRLAVGDATIPPDVETWKLPDDL